MRLAALMIVAASMFGTASGVSAETRVGGRPQAVADTWLLDPPGIEVEIWASGLRAPWGIAFLPDRRAVVSERGGRLVLVARDGGTRALGTMDILEDDESGLMGIAVHPRFPEPPFIYVMFTFRQQGATGNAVARFRLEHDALSASEVVLAGIPAGNNHNGGRIAFGPDGMLYVGTGNIWRRELAQDLGSLAGKILRVRPDGQVPADNPFAGSPVWSLGHRNVQGLAWRPGTGTLYATEHGPSGEVGFGAFDEINRVFAGRNYGWPRVVGAAKVEGLMDPIVAWPEVTTPPSGAAFWRDDLYVATLGSEALVRVRFEGSRIAGVERWFTDGEQSRYGRLRDAVLGPGGLYVLTGNHDWRGDGRLGSDHVLRIKLKHD